MTPEEWRKIKEVLEVAIELNPTERESYLDNACTGGGVDRTEIESLLCSHDAGGSFLEDSGGIEALGLMEHVGLAPWKGRRLGAYRIEDEIGEGGMGKVYRAVRADGMYDKQVAIKVIHGGLSGDYFNSRFIHERQILARLEHPNIARLLDGGVTEEGLPYLVLEYVAGLPIDEYCARHDLSVAERLKLFRTVCSAVQYAHQNLIVHRDLKPGNILVGEDGQPKLLDFGIAKILAASENDAQNNQTVTVLRMMTPDFASPEQVRGEVITTSSDIYSLGVILYVLLTGHRPYKVASSAAHEIVKAICDTDPEKPSTAASRPQKKEGQEKAAGETKTFHAQNLDRLRRALSGDLDNIVLKALRKEAERRYATVEQFSEDVRRHLEHLPVLARKDTVGYRAAKFMARHKAGVATAAMVTLTLIAGLVVTVREERLAQRRFDDVRSLANSLIFDIHDSIKDLPGSTPARKLIVDRALQYLNSLSQESRDDITLQRELATAYERVGLVQGHYLQNSLGDTQGSLVSYQKALQLRQQFAAKSGDWNDRLALAQAHRLVANQQWAVDDKRGARENIDKAVGLSVALDKAHPNDFQVLHELGFDYQVSSDIGYQEAEGGGAKGMEDRRKALATDEAMLRIKPEDLRTLDAYAIDLSYAGGAVEDTDPKAALSFYQKGLEIEQKLRERSREIRYARGVARTYGLIASVYEGMGAYSRALENDKQDLAIYQELIRVDPKNVLLQQGLAITYVNTATRLAETGNVSLSLTYMQKGVETMQAVVASSPQNARQRVKLAEIYTASGSNLLRLHKPEAALKETERACAIYKSFQQADVNDSGASINEASCVKQIGVAAALSGDSERAAQYFRQALAVVEPLLSSPRVDLNSLYTAADAYSGLGDIKLEEARHQGQPSASQRSNWNEARSWYLKSLNTWHRIEKPSHESPNGFDAGDPASVAKSLQACERALSASY